MLLRALVSELISKNLIKNKAEVPNLKIDDVTESLSKCRPGIAFFALKGFRYDGHSFVTEAYSAGTRIFFTERELSMPGDGIQVVCTDTRRAYASACALLFGHPDREMRLLGVTGTKGKTTVCTLACTMLGALGHRCARIGTDGIFCGDFHSDTENTTPDSYTLFSSLRKFRDLGVETVFLEVSSQALYLGRVFGAEFYCAVFTNLSKDHIGVSEHPDFAHYASSKRMLFQTEHLHFAVVNSDDPACDFMLEGCSAEVIRCGADSGDFRAYDIKSSLCDGAPECSFSLSYRGRNCRVSSNLPGIFNVRNILLASACVYILAGALPDSCPDALRRASVPGRCEFIPLNNGASAVIDYAHNGDSLSRMLSMLRGFFPKRLTCVFGSVGMRSYDRRSDLASAAEKYADRCIITSDNPGDEPAEDICEEIRSYFENPDIVTVIPDRCEAVRYAIRTSFSGEIILFAGKGREEYQLVRGIKLRFSERDIIRRCNEKYLGKSGECIDFEAVL